MSNEERILDILAAMQTQMDSRFDRVEKEMVAMQGKMTAMRGDMETLR